MGTIAQLEMAASSDLLWALTKKSNCFLVKRNGLQLTTEPNNLMNKNCFKYSGLANEEAVGVEECPRGITLKNKTEGAYYRRDLTKAAQARWYKIWKSQNKGEV